MATIIRKDNPREMPTGKATHTIAFSFSDMRGQADDYLETVRTEAAKIIQQAHQQAEQIRRQAEVAGRKAAEAAVERVMDDKVGKRMQTLLPALEQLVRELNDMKGDLLVQWERAALGVSSSIARRVIRRELRQHPEISLEIIAESLRLATGCAEIELHISPTDYENLGTQVERLAASLGQLAPSSIVADESIAPGGCVVQTKFGEIDQRIESQLQRIEEELS